MMRTPKPLSQRLFPPIAVIIAIFGLWSCQTEQSPTTHNTPADQVKVDWTWKRTVKGDVNFIYGTVQNNNDQLLQQVTLEFRTQDKQGKTLMTRNFTLESVPPHSQKLFSEDYPVNAREDSGFVKIKEVTLAK